MEMVSPFSWAADTRSAKAVRSERLASARVDRAFVAASRAAISRASRAAANDVKVDITINEVLCFPLQDRPIQRTYDSFDDLPEGPTIKVYAIEEIVAEKLLALSDRARTEPRDLYDLWYLLGTTKLRIVEMRAELDTKLALRQRVIAGMEQAIAAKENRLRRLWTTRLAHQMSHLPPFDEVFREVLRAVRAADLPKVEAG